MVSFNVRESIMMQCPVPDITNGIDNTAENKCYELGGRNRSSYKKMG